MVLGESASLSEKEAGCLRFIFALNIGELRHIKSSNRVGCLGKPSAPHTTYHENGLGTDREDREKVE
jgi:hypothetical protein